MEKETIIKWLRECSDEGCGESCENCPFECHEDCAGALMAEAVKDLAEQ